MTEIFRNTDAFSWTSTVNVFLGDDCGWMIKIAQDDFEDYRNIFLYEDEAIAAAKAILKHFGEDAA